MRSEGFGFDDFFYQFQETKTGKHCEIIYPNNIKDDKDIRQYRSLVEDCFALHLPRNPQKLTKRDIRLAPEEANKFYRAKDIDNLFISDFYDYPLLIKFFSSDLSTPERTIQKDQVFAEILGHLANPNAAVVLVGDVGEGKSALLKRLAIDLADYTGGQKYIPVIIDIQRYNKIIEKENTEEAFRNFWTKVCEDVVHYLETEYQMLIPTSRTEATESAMSAKASLHATLSAVIAKLKATISSSTSEKTAVSATRTFDVFSQIQNAAKELYEKQKTRMVLVFDNLDTFCYEHERFMLFQKGFAKLKTKIVTIREITNEVKSNLSNSEISFLFTVRPYVYYHVFQSNIHDISQNNVSAVYRIKPVDPIVPIRSRLSLLKELAEKLNDSSLAKGKKEAVKNHNDKFTTIIQKCLDHRDKPFVKLYNLSNQGMRSVVEIYHSCYYHPDIYTRYFTHNIVYLYMLGKRKLYCQISPDWCSLKQIYYFPNMFLVVCPNYYNIGYPEACQPHKITYWLKYLVLWVCYIRGKVSIKELLNIFHDYEDHVVRLAIGSLATVNEYNCLKMEFVQDIDIGRKNEDLSSSIEKFVETTYLIPTRRGEYLVKNQYCLDLDCLQHYVDDWLLPLPKRNQLHLNDELLNGIYVPQDKTYSYDYLLNAANYEQNRRKIIRKKSKQSLLLMYFLESAFEAEQSIHFETWKSIKELSSSKGEPLINADKFEVLKKRLIEASFRTIGRDWEFKKELEEYKAKLDKNKNELYKLFLGAVGITIQYSCQDKSETLELGEIP